MNNKLPKIFANKIEKKLNNNKEVYISSNIKKNENIEISKEKNDNKQNSNKIKGKTTTQKINEILKINKYVYKVPVKIELENNQIITNIIGKNNKNLITINNELIKIEDIKNIEIYEKNE